MNEQDTGLAIVDAALDNLPMPVKTSFLKAASDLLGGLTAVPAAWLRQKAQGIEDTTVGRSTVAASLAMATAEEVRKDPLLMQAAVEVLCAQHRTEGK